MSIFKRIGWGFLIIIVTLGCGVYLTTNLLFSEDLPFSEWFEEDKSFTELVEEYDVIIMKHCYPASNVKADTGNPDPASERKSTENYKAVYRLLRAKFDEYPDTMFIVWTLPPLHNLRTDSDKATRATAFSEWLQTDFLTEDGPHPNIYVWDFRSIVMDPDTNFLKYEYERNHESSDSHPNDAANNVAGPQFAQFIIDSTEDFTGGITARQEIEIIFLHRSTGRNVYKYSDLGVSGWFDNYNDTHRTRLEISEDSYPSDGNMPINYYHSWIAN